MAEEANPIAVAVPVEDTPTTAETDNSALLDNADLSAGMKVYISEEVAETRYHVIGAEMQIVNVSLAPDESVDVSPGAMMHHGPNIYASPRCSCSCGRYCTGESNVKISFVNKGSEPETIGLTPVYPAKIIPLHLSELGSVIVRTTSYMCGIGKVDINVAFGKCCHPTLCLGGVGFIRQRLSGEGIAFLQAGGTVLEKTLEDKETIAVDQESVIGWQETVSLGVQTFAGVCGCCSVCYGGEGCFLATLTGPGKIYITSMSFSKWHRTLAPTAAEISARNGGKTEGEGGEGGDE